LALIVGGHARAHASGRVHARTTEWLCETEGRALTSSAPVAFADVLGCPLCHGPVPPAEGETLACAACDARYVVTDGLADLVPPQPRQAETPNIRIMESGLLARVYERAWRPLLTRLLTGMSHDAERAWSLDRLAPAPDATVLDLACGPGNTTRTIAAAVPAGRVLGIDFSAAMLREALAASPASGATVGYVRGDAHRLPLQPASVDAANCAGAFYLFSDPPRVLTGIAAALRPAGLLTLMTSQQPRVGGAATAALVRPGGLRVYARGEMELLLDDAGFDVLDRRIAGLMLLVAARRR
jgi:ubiquinone/menaquinone biosynthesis C-methylase UbiE/uncharacterized protein YbaR (Trm112 family)